MSASDSDGTPGSNAALEEAPKRSLIRKGQHKPYFKATRQQIEQRIEVAAVLSDCGFEKGEIHRVFRERYAVEWRQTDRYMARARGHSPLTPDPSSTLPPSCP